MKKTLSEGAIRKRIKNKIRLKTIIISLIGILSLILILVFFRRNTGENITYKEKGNANYTVFLTENNFFDKKSLPENNQYISSLIDYIKVKFNYDMQMSGDYTDYMYKYKIQAETKVIEKSTENDIYSSVDILKEGTEINANNSNFNIDYETDINYKNYDDMVRKLTTVYKLDNVESKLIVTLYVELLDKNENVKNKSEISVNIPLNEKTVNIEIENNINSDESKIFLATQIAKKSWAFIVFAVLLMLIDVNKIYDVVNYSRRTSSKDAVYNIELKKILKNYKSYIQKTNSGFDKSKYNVIELDSFKDMLDIREIIQQPILMFQNLQKTKTHFYIITSTKVLYLYELNSIPSSNSNVRNIKVIGEI